MISRQTYEGCNNVFITIDSLHRLLVGIEAFTLNETEANPVSNVFQLNEMMILYSLDYGTFTVFRLAKVIYQM